MNRVKLSDTTNFIGCWDLEKNFLFEEMIKFFENNKQSHKSGVTGFGLDLNSKKSTDLSLDPKIIKDEKINFLKVYFEQLFNCFNDYKNQWPFLKNTFNKLDIPRFNIQKYEIGGHYSLVHCERSSLRSMHRVFAWMTYLNDVVDGGETSFVHFNLKIKPKQGRTLIWPSEWTHAHKAEILNKGDKYIITGWMQLPLFD